MFQSPKKKKKKEKKMMMGMMHLWPSFQFLPLWIIIANPDSKMASIHRKF
jgi:hypothetical protein